MSVYCEMKEMHSSSKANPFRSLVVRRVDIPNTSIVLSRSGQLITPKHLTSSHPRC